MSIAPVCRNPSGDLGGRLVEEGLLSARDLEEARRQVAGGVRLTRALLELGLVAPDALARALSRFTGLDVTDLDGVRVSASLIERVPMALAKEHCLIPVAEDASGVTIAIADPTDRLALHRVRFSTGSRVIAVIANADAIEASIRSHYREEASPMLEPSSLPAQVSVVDLMSAAERGEVAKICSGVVRRLLSGDAAGAEIIPRANRLHIEWRREPETSETSRHALDVHEGVIAHLKLLARLDVAQQWRPQRGLARFSQSENMSLAATMLEVTTAPTRLGESASVRVVKER